MPTFRDIINELESVPSPKPIKSSPSSTLASTEVGDLFLLSGDKAVVRCHIRPSPRETKLVESLKLNVSEQVDLSPFNHLEANVDGSLVLLWSADRLAVIEVPKPSTERSDGEEALCAFHCLCPLEDPPRLVSAAFHPLSKHVIVLLYETRHLILWNLRDLTNGQQHYSLPSNLSFRSFSFGPPSEWLRFTVFLLTATGSVLGLCPVIPKGILLPKAAIAPLWAWLADNESQEELEDYASLAREQMTAAFGCAADPVDDQDAFQLTSDEDDLPGYTVMLQGPLHVLRDGTAEGVVVDLCCPGPTATSDAAPVLALAYNTGTVEVLLIEDWSPAWRAIDLSVRPMAIRPADLLLADRFTTGATGNLRLLADPALPYCMHLIGNGAYLLHSAFLQGQEAAVSRAMVTYTPSTAEEMSGATVLLDPFLGHLLILRYASSVVAVNLSVHLKLCELQAVVTNKATVTHTPAEGDAQWAATQRLMVTIAEGLSAMPPVTMAVTNGEEVVGMSQAEQKKLLLTTAQALDRTVITPMQSLSQGIAFAHSIAQERYTMQKELIDGPKGLQQTLQGLASEQTQLTDRVDALHSRYADLVEQADRCLALVQALRPKVSQGERIYRTQLTAWSAQVSEMGRKVDDLRVMARRASLENNPVPMSPKASDDAAPRTPFMLRRALHSTPMSPTVAPTTPSTAPAIVLSQEDRSLCMDILAEQANKIEAFTKTVHRLEKRLEASGSANVSKIM